ncbi:MAG: hypothetical protein RL173_2131 [Fibrobacterota bacterium]|jgi:flagellar biogenesis protein FliO
MKFRRILSAVAVSCGLALAAPEVDSTSVDSTTSRLRADSLRATMTPDSGLEDKLAAAQAAWDKGSGQPTPDESPVKGPSLFGLIVQVFASLAVLGAAAFAMVFLTQRARRKRGGEPGTGAGMIDLLESKSVGPGRHVALLRLHNRVVAVAFAGSSATLLSEFQGNDAAEIVAESGDGKTPIRDFAATLDTLMDKFRGGAPKPAPRREETP